MVSTRQLPGGVPGKPENKNRLAIEDSLARVHEIPVPAGLTRQHPVILRVWRNGFYHAPIHRDQFYTADDYDFWLAAESDNWSYDWEMWYLGRTNLSFRLSRHKRKQFLSGRPGYNDPHPRARDRREAARAASRAAARAARAAAQATTRRARAAAQATTRRSRRARGAGAAAQVTTTSAQQALPQFTTVNQPNGTSHQNVASLGQGTRAASSPLSVSVRTSMVIPSPASGGQEEREEAPQGTSPAHRTRDDEEPFTLLQNRPHTENVTRRGPRFHLIAPPPPTAGTSRQGVPQRNVPTPNSVVSRWRDEQGVRETPHPPQTNTPPSVPSWEYLRQRFHNVRETFAKADAVEQGFDRLVQRQAQGMVSHGDNTASIAPGPSSQGTEQAALPHPRRDGTAYAAPDPSSQGTEQAALPRPRRTVTYPEPYATSLRSTQQPRAGQDDEPRIIPSFQEFIANVERRHDHDRHNNNVGDAMNISEAPYTPYANRPVEPVATHQVNNRDPMRFGVPSSNSQFRFAPDAPSTLRPSDDFAALLALSEAARMKRYPGMERVESERVERAREFQSEMELYSGLVRQGDRKRQIEGQSEEDGEREDEHRKGTGD